MGLKAATAIGFDFNCGRLDVTDHPFCTGLGPKDCRITTRYDERHFPGAFFGTMLDMELRGLGVDTVVIAGCTTSGCIRASAVDSMQNRFHTIVVREAVGDRASTPHEVNLFDIDSKYGDVVSLEEVEGYLRGLSERGGLGATAGEDFQRWWHGGSAAE